MVSLKWSKPDRKSNGQYKVVAKVDCIYLKTGTQVAWFSSHALHTYRWTKGQL
jgi:hypothetical protein